MNSVISRFIPLLVIFISPFFSNPAFSFENDIEAISKEIATKLKDMQLDTIAVSDFTDLQGNVTEPGGYRLSVWRGVDISLGITVLR